LWSSALRSKSDGLALQVPELSVQVWGFDWEFIMHIRPIRLWTQHYWSGNGSGRR